MKTQLVCTFSKKYQIDGTLSNIKENFNILNVFEYIQTLFNSLLLSYNALAYENYLAISDNSFNYIIENFTYLLYYGINKIVFNQCFNNIFIYLQ